jgi:hypothetical protein
MANWCKHYEMGGFFSSNTCNVSGKSEPIPSTYGYYCQNDGYHCPWYENAYGSSGGCFITTVTCDILGKADHDPVMDSLRSFRDGVLQKAEEYDSVLKLYDKVGPVISFKLFHDKDRDEKAAKLYSKLEEFADIANKGNHNEAAKKYIMMTLRLVAEYSMQDQYRTLRDSNFGYQEGEFDRKVAGHGKKMTKTIENE